MNNKIKYWTIGMQEDGGVRLNLAVNGKWYELDIADKDVQSMHTQITIVKPAIQERLRDNE